MSLALPGPTGPARRRLLAAGGALALAPLLAACGDEKDSPAQTDTSKCDGPWSFQDDRGRTVKLDRRPERLVAFVSTAAALFDYGIECTGIFGPSKPVDGKPSPQAGAMDVSEPTSLGTEFGQFQHREVRGPRARPADSNMFPAPDLWYVPQEAVKKIEALAPTVGVNVARTSLLTPLARTAQLAESLGADLKAKKATDARARFDAAAETLREAARANKGLKVLAMTGDPQNMYVAVPDSYCYLAYFKDLGVEFVEGKKSDEWGFWEFLGWENADKYHADLIMIDNRANAMPRDQLDEKATWRELPAVKAGQTVPWSMEERYSYAGYVPILEQLAAAVEKSEKLAA